MADDRQDGRETLNPAALAVADAAHLLGMAEDVVRKHIGEGAPAAAAQRAVFGQLARWHRLPEITRST